MLLLCDCHNYSFVTGAVLRQIEKGLPQSRKPGAKQEQDSDNDDDDVDDDLEDTNDDLEAIGDSNKVVECAERDINDFDLNNGKSESPNVNSEECKNDNMNIDLEKSNVNDSDST